MELRFMGLYHERFGLTCCKRREDRHAPAHRGRTCCKCTVGGTFVLISVACIAVVTFLLYDAFLIETPKGVTCVQRTNSRGRHGPREDKMNICYPEPGAMRADGTSWPVNGTYSLFLFAHGDGAGGYLFNYMYRSMQTQIAAEGFVVPAYLSCWFDNNCNNGQGTVVKALETIDYVKQNYGELKLDPSLPYTVSGHSTGGRTALMLGAMRDSNDYLQSICEKVSHLGKTDPGICNFDPAVSADSWVRPILDSITAAVAFHPDDMSDSDLNPDVKTYEITDTPVFIITGEDDLTIERPGSAWGDFKAVASPDKIFVNMKDATHIDAKSVNAILPFMVDFARKYTLGNSAVDEKLCGSTEQSIRNKVPLAVRSENSGDHEHKDISFLCCRDGVPVPPKIDTDAPGRNTCQKGWSPGAFNALEVLLADGEESPNGPTAV